uniref:DMT family transporter n=1 Tax=Ignavibacterium album TaxID=591197 RepID=A0A832G7S8_9BACT
MHRPVHRTRTKPRCILLRTCGALLFSGEVAFWQWEDGLGKRNTRGLVSGLLAASIWGGMYVVSKVVLQVIPPFTLLTLRLVIGALVLGVVVVATRTSRLERGQTLKLLAVGVIGYGLSLGLQFVGTKLSTASNGALVTSATPAFVLLFAPLVLQEKSTPRGVLALVVATLGVVAVIDPRHVDLSSALFIGNLCLVGAAVTWALYSVLVRRVSRSTPVLLASTVMLLGGLPVSVPLAVGEVSASAIGPISPGVVGGVLFLGVIATAAAMFLWNYAFAHLPAATASLTFFAQPVVGTLLGWLFLGELITPTFLLGGALIGAGIFIARE